MGEKLAEQICAPTVSNSLAYSRSSLNTSGIKCVNRQAIGLWNKDDELSPICKYNWKMLVTQSHPTLCDPVDCSSPGYSVHGILQARILEWVAISFSRGSSQPRDWSQVSCIGGRFFTVWATRVSWKMKVHLQYAPLFCFSTITAAIEVSVIFTRDPKERYWIRKKKFFCAFPFLLVSWLGRGQTYVMSLSRH